MGGAERACPKHSPLGQGCIFLPSYSSRRAGELSPLRATSQSSGAKNSAQDWGAHFFFISFTSHPHTNNTIYMNGEPGAAKRLSSVGKKYQVWISETYEKTCVVHIIKPQEYGEIPLNACRPTRENGDDAEL